MIKLKTSLRERGDKVKIFTNFPETIANKLNEIITQNPDEANIFVYTYQDELILKSPNTTILIVNSNKTEHIEGMVKKGVLKDNILILQSGQKISISTIKDRIYKIKKRISRPQVVNTETSVIAVSSYKGGVGCTAIATALVYHYSIRGETVALVDTSSSHNTVYYMGKPPLEDAGEYKFARTIQGDIYTTNNNNNPEKILEKLKKEYQRIILDCPFTETNYKKVVVVDSDLRTLEITAKKLKQSKYILVANRIPRVFLGTFPALAMDILKRKPDLQIPTDPEGCQAVLSEYHPVNADGGSEIIAIKIGELAAILESEEKNK